MFRLDTDDLDDSMEGVSRVSFDRSECSGLSLDAALSTNSFEAHRNALDNSGTKTKFGLVFTTDDNSPRSVASHFNNHLAQRSSNATLRQRKLRDISGCVIADDSNSTTTQSMSASCDEIYQYSIINNKNNELHINEVESVSTMTHSPKNWNSTVMLSSNNTIGSTVSNYDNRDTFGFVRPAPSTTMAVDRRNHFNVTCCRVRTRRSSKISKTSARILDLPRDAEFDSSCDSSIDEEGDAYHEKDNDSKGLSCLSNTL